MNQEIAILIKDNLNEEISVCSSKQTIQTSEQMVGTKGAKGTKKTASAATFLLSESW